MVIFVIFGPIWLKFGLKVPGDVLSAKNVPKYSSFESMATKKSFRFIKILKRTSRRKSLRGLPDPDYFMS